MDTNLTVAAVRDVILAIPGLASWPEVVQLFDPTSKKVRMDWQLPALACQAVGGDLNAALPAVTAIACLQASIILVDDMLDQDPRGEYHRLGAGRTANLALALESAGLAAIDQSKVDGQRKAAATAALAQAALTTALGQDLDVQNLRGEANYWRVVKTKSTPFYGVAFQAGALVGGASIEVAAQLYEAGALLGEIVQITDDLLDAFESPANPDWLEGRNNLTLLYATTAQHPQNERFRELLSRTGDPEVLREAQQILITCGAVSYCVYLLVDRYTKACELLRRLELPERARVEYPFTLQVQPVVTWLRGLGLPVPPQLAEPVA